MFLLKKSSDGYFYPTTPLQLAFREGEAIPHLNGDSEGQPDYESIMNYLTMIMQQLTKAMNKSKFNNKNPAVSNETADLILPIVFFFIFGYDLVHCGNGALNHAVVRFLGGYVLEPYARSRNNFCKEVVMPAGKFDKLVSDADGKR